MSASYTVDGDEILTVRRGTVSLTSSADHGAPGQGSLIVNDTAGTLDIVGQKDFASDEDACSNPITYRGFIAPREYAGRDVERNPTGRDITVAVEDLSAMLGFRGITGADSKRPPETVAQRGAWLMASPYVSGLFANLGRCEFPGNVNMDKADYKNSYPGDVLTDMALAVGGINWYIRDFGSGAELVFRNDNSSTEDESDIRISNVIADVNGDMTGLTFYPSKDFTLRRDPSRVKSKLAYTYAKGTVLKERAATAAAFNGERFGTSSNSNIKTATAASRAANAVLRQLASEEDVLSGRILVPSSACNLVNQGDRMEGRWSHLATEGYGSMTWFRVLEITKRPLLRPVNKYELELKLTPQEDIDVASCPYEATPSGTFYPLGASSVPLSADPNDLGIRAVSDGFTYYLRPGYYYPVTPSPGHHGLWHFWELSAGGLGTIDYAGDCAQNTLQFMPVGPGTLTIQTEIYAGSSRPLAAHWFNLVTGTSVSLGTFTSGDVIEAEVTDDCVNIVRVTDGPGTPCGGKWGWSDAVWVAA